MQSNTRRSAATSDTFSDINLCHCSDPEGCVTLQDILKYFNAAISEEQAWALIYQSACMYQNALYCQLGETEAGRAYDVRILNEPRNFNIHRDGTVHISFNSSESVNYASSEQRILCKLAYVVFKAIDNNGSDDNDCIISTDLESILCIMSNDSNDDEGIGNDSVDSDDQKLLATKELNLIIDLCKGRVHSSADVHYNAVCRALATESLELRAFLQNISCGDTKNLHFTANIETSKQELLTLPSSDWSRLWMQVIEQLRHGVRLRKCNYYERTSLEFELTPYEILMDDIRLKNYKLRKVVVNGDVSNRIKMDAHAIILEFIRSRPPLKKVSERKLAARQRTPTPREELMDSIRRGRVLKQITPRIKTKLLTPIVQSENRFIQIKSNARSARCQAPRNKQRLIRVDPEIFKDDDLYRYNELSSPSTPLSTKTFQKATAVKAPGPIHLSRSGAQRNHSNCEVNANSLNNNKGLKLSNGSSSPKSRPDLVPNRRNLFTAMSSSQLKTLDEDVVDGPSTKQILNSSKEQVTLTMKEVVHMRFVRTKIILDNIDNQTKNDVENRNICFHCRRTRFKIFPSIWEWGVKCKLCSRTVCSKCCSKERIPVDCFQKVPVGLLSPKSLAAIEYAEYSTGDHYNKNGKRMLTSTKSIDSAKCLWYPLLPSRYANESPPQGEMMCVCLDCREFVLNILQSSK